MTLLCKVVKAVSQLIVRGRHLLLSCALAFDQLAEPSQVQLRSFASSLQLDCEF